MAIEFKQQSYATPPHFLVFPDHYICVAQSFAKDHSLSVTVDGRKIIKAGTLYPSNDSAALGIVFSDLDVTDGDQNGAILIHGFVATAKLPVIPVAAAKSALKGVQFLPLFATTCTITATAKTVPLGTAADEEYTVVVTAVDDLFRADANDVSKWTFTGATTTKVSLSAVSIAADGKTATLTLLTTATTVAGSNTIIPLAGAMRLGVAPTAAIAVATVPVS